LEKLPETMELLANRKLTVVKVIVKP